MVQRLSIVQKLYLMMGCLALPLFALWALSVFSMNTQSAMRAYVGGEGLWSKAQKQAAYDLLCYARSRDESDYNTFLQRLSVPLGDHVARVELERPFPDWERARQGFLRGGNDAEDIPGMFALFRRFRHLSYVERAIAIWSTADVSLQRLRLVADQLHHHVGSARTSPATLQSLLQQVDEINRQLTQLENAFSATLGDAARWLSRVVDIAMGLAALICIALGLTVATRVARGLVLSIQQIRTAAQRVREGDYSSPLPIDNHDETGELANAFEEMRRHRQQAEEDLRATNKELESFSYSVSHDLRAPLRAIDGFAQILVEDHAPDLKAEARSLLGTIRENVHRMSDLIDGLLAFSQLSRRALKISVVDIAVLVRQITDELLALEKGRSVQIKLDRLVSVLGDPTLLREVFSNLISNALKFSRRNPNALIEIGYRPESHRHVFFVKDNGVGFDMQYAGKLFGVFQRLHAVGDFEGNGIGLALVQRIVLRHGGSVWAESRLREGATFYVALPTQLLNPVLGNPSAS